MNSAMDMIFVYIRLYIVVNVSREMPKATQTTDARDTPEMEEMLRNYRNHTNRDHPGDREARRETANMESDG